MSDSITPSASGKRARGKKYRRRSLSVKRRLLVPAAVVGLLLCGAGLWISHRVSEVKQHLTTASSLMPELKLQIARGHGAEARSLVSQIQAHTQAASAAVDDPLWKVSSEMPLIGQNFTAVREVAQVADAVVTGAGGPLLDTLDVLASGALNPHDGVLNLVLLEQASPSIVAAAQTTDRAAARLEALDTDNLFDEVSGPLSEVTRELQNVRGPINVAAEFTQLLPLMLGSGEPRNYLVLIQNNAELRATGGLSGALAVVRIDHGKVELTDQATATELGKFVPRIPNDPEQEHIYSTKLGAQISGVNLTPDFPTAARTAKAMWETRHSTIIDGVIALDPIVLSHVLKASGPLPFNEPTDALPSVNMPSTLSAENVAKTLMSDVYLTMDYAEQDLFFAAAARRVFETLATGKAPIVELIQALAQSTQENRLHVWSRVDAEQRILTSTRLGGSMLLGPDAGPGSFGVFFNDGTGSKMDYYSRHSVELVSQCTAGDKGQTTVRMTVTNTAPTDAATSLPAGVTGGGFYGVPPGVIQTNIVVYGPPEATVETLKLDGISADFAPYLHGTRPVGVVTTRLAPGEARAIELSFGKIASQVEPSVVVTPTVQDVRDVVRNPTISACGEKSGTLN